MLRKELFGYVRVRVRVRACQRAFIVLLLLQSNLHILYTRLLLSSKFSVAMPTVGLTQSPLSGVFRGHCMGRDPRPLAYFVSYVACCATT